MKKMFTCRLLDALADVDRAQASLHQVGQDLQQDAGSE